MAAMTPATDSPDPWQTAGLRPGGIPLVAWRGSAYTGAQELLDQVSGILPALQARAAWLAGRAGVRLEESCVVAVPSEATPLQMLAEGVAEHESVDTVAGARLALATLAASGQLTATAAQGPGGLVAGWRLPEALVPFLLWVQSAPTNCPTALTLTVGGIWPLIGVSQNGAACTGGLHTETAGAVVGADQLLVALWRAEPAPRPLATWAVSGDDEALVAAWEKALHAGKPVDDLPGRDPGKGVWPLIVHAPPGGRRMVGFSPVEDGFAATIS